MHIANRAAEFGGQILQPGTYSWGNVRPIAIRIIEDATITTITSPNMDGIDYYNAKTVATTDPLIMATVSSLAFSGGVVQVVYGGG